MSFQGRRSTGGLHGSPGALVSPPTQQALGNALGPSRDSPSSHWHGRKAAQKRHGLLSPVRNPPHASRGAGGEDVAAPQRPHRVARERRRPTAVGTGKGGERRERSPSLTEPGGAARGEGAGGVPRRGPFSGVSPRLPPRPARAAPLRGAAVLIKLLRCAESAAVARVSVLLRARRAGDVPGNDPVYTEGKVDTPPRFSVFLACPGAFRGVNLGAWLLKFWPQEAETWTNSHVSLWFSQVLSKKRQGRREDRWSEVQKKENNEGGKNGQWETKLRGQQLAAIQSRCFYTLPCTESSVHEVAQLTDLAKTTFLLS